MKNPIPYIIILIVLSLSACIKEKPPTCSITFPANNEEFEQGEMVRIIVDADDENGTVSVVRFYVDGIGVGSSASFPFIFDLNTEGVDLGMHTIKAEARDDDGLKATDEVSIRIIESSEIDTVLVTILNPSENEEFEQGEIVGIYVDIDDQNGMVTEVRFYVNDFGVSSSAGFPYSYEWNTEGVDLGIYTIKAEARDETGPLSYDEISIQIIERVLGPVSIEIVNPVNNDVFDQGDIVSIFAELDDIDERVTEVRFYIDGFGVSSAIGFPYSYYWNTEDVDTGIHTISVEARDGEGIIDTDEISIQVIN